MPCSGNASFACGGSNRLNFYTYLGKQYPIKKEAEKSIDGHTSGLFPVHFSVLFDPFLRTS